ncbi:hypothetical protein SCACP_28510 [Sporomusa carbonis]
MRAGLRDLLMLVSKEMKLLIDNYMEYAKTVV